MNLFPLLVKHLTHLPAYSFISYELFIADRDDLSEIEWEYVVIDEGHRIKNKARNKREGQREKIRERNKEKQRDRERNRER